MIILLGASGYIGVAFAAELKARDEEFVTVSRQELDYTKFDILVEFLRKQKPSFLINAAGYIGRPNVDACEMNKADTLLGNTLLAQTVVQACIAMHVPWAQVSSGCIFAGAKILKHGQEYVEKDLLRPDLKLLIKNNPNAIRGFKEDDTPNFSFRDMPCSFYSGSKALAEEAIDRLPQGYIWRLRIPFDEINNSRNYLTKIQKYDKVYDNVNSLSHRGDYARACVDLWQRRAPFGIYNVTNPGFVTTQQVVGMIQHILKPKRDFEFWLSDKEFYDVGASTPRSNCVLDVSKLLSTGVRLRHVKEALEAALTNWKPN